MQTKTINKTLNITFPHPPGAGGPGSFQIRFEKELQNNGWQISYAGDAINPDLIFVVGGTRKLFWLWQMKRKGIPILYRLDGIVWLHKKQKIGFKKYWLTEFRNWTSKFIHAFLATKIIYQSHFVKNWWNREGWRKRQNTSIVHNGVVLPEKGVIETVLKSRNTNRLVILEGVIDYTPYAVRLLNDLAENLPEDIQIELYGKFENKQEVQNLHSRLQYKGFLNRNQVNDVMAGSVYLSLDINPACPNTVAEALACGAPIVSFDTGALPELVDESCGKIIPYGSNPWELEYPNVKDLEKAVVDIFSKYNQFSECAYQKAKQNYTLQFMFDQYNDVIKEVLKND